MLAALFTQQRTVLCLAKQRGEHLVTVLGLVARRGSRLVQRAMLL